MSQVFFYFYILSALACWGVLAHGLYWHGEDCKLKENIDPYIDAGLLPGIAGFSIFPIINSFVAIFSIAWLVSQNSRNPK